MDSYTTSIVQQWFKGNSRTFRFTVVEEGTTIPVDITSWPIAAEVFDAGTGEIKKATQNIVDGGDEQILITDPTNGVFEVYFTKDETDNFAENATIEIAEFSSSGERTLYKARIKFVEPAIDWVVLK